MALPAEEAIEPMRRSLSARFLLKAYIVCLSFINLCFLNVWAELPGKYTSFFQRFAVSWSQLGAVTLSVILLAAALWVPVFLIARSGKPVWVRILKWCVFLGLMLPLNVVRIISKGTALSSIPVLHGQAGRALLVVAGVSAGIILLWKWERLSTRLTSTVLVILAPTLPLVVANVAWGIATGPPGDRFMDKPLAGALVQKSGAPHVLWFIFDEWDQALTFEARPSNIALPELDRFRNQSFRSDRAYSPARSTVISVPSLLVGKTFTSARPEGASDLLLSYKTGQPPERLSSESSIFSDASDLGFNSGITGFYLPYCRLFSAVACEWHAAIGFLPAGWESPLSTWRFMQQTAALQVSFIPFARRLGIGRALDVDPLSTPLHGTTYQQTREAALRSIVDPRLNLVFVHWNVPHLPSIYDAAKDRISQTPTSYPDNLELVDRILHDCRLALEKEGTWDSSTILLTSDHPLRLTSWKRDMLARPPLRLTQHSEVPFLLKLAGQKQGLAYRSAMQTVVTKDLLLTIMKGELTQPEQVAEWLDHHPPRQ